MSQKSDHELTTAASSSQSTVTWRWHRRKKLYLNHSRRDSRPQTSVKRNPHSGRFRGIVRSSENQPNVNTTTPPITSFSPALIQELVHRSLSRSQTSSITHQNWNEHQINLKCTTYESTAYRPNHGSKPRRMELSVDSWTHWSLNTIAGHACMQ